jgi:hypothetical protein
MKGGTLKCDVTAPLHPRPTRARVLLLLFSSPPLSIIYSNSCLKLYHARVQLTLADLNHKVTPNDLTVLSEVEIGAFAWKYGYDITDLRNKAS